MIVTGPKIPGLTIVIDLLSANGVTTDVFYIEGEPTIRQVDEALRHTNQAQWDHIIGLGGGSAIDMAKAISALETNPGNIRDYLEVIGLGKKITQPCLPVIAIPTTAGTGAEVTRNAVLMSPDDKVKVSLRSPYLLPKLAVVDPELTSSLSPQVTASTGMDALVQLIKSFVSSRSNPLTDAICVEGIKKWVGSIRSVYHDGNDLEGRENMALASLFGGLALANAGLGAVHGFASVIGGMYAAPHGAICAKLLTPVISTNNRALLYASQTERAITDRTLEKYRFIARLLTGNHEAEIDDGIGWLECICTDLAIPGLSAYGILEKDIELIVEKAAVSSSMRANPIQLSVDELHWVMTQAL